MRDTLFGVLFGNALLFVLMAALYCVLAWAVKLFCFEGAEKPHYWAFFFGELALLALFGFFCAGVIGYTWFKLAGADAAPVWVAYLFQKI